LKNRSENLTGRSQISSILKGNSSSIARESGGIWIVQADLQPISFKSDRLLVSLIYAREQLASAAGLPLSMHLLNQRHGRLMLGVRGADMQLLNQGAADSAICALAQRLAPA